MLFINAIVLLMRGLIGSGCVINFSVVGSENRPLSGPAAFCHGWKLNLVFVVLLIVIIGGACVCGENDDGHWLI